MSITTYNELKLAVADWLNREDLTGQIPDFISVAESQMQRQLRRKTVVTTLSIGADSVALPNDCAEVRSVHFPDLPTASDRRTLRLVTPEYLTDFKRVFSVPGIPRYCSVIEDTLYVVPEPAETYEAEIHYFQDLPQLSDTQTTNWLLQEHPDIYLYGALKEAASFLEHDERAAMWDVKYTKAIEEANNVRQREEYGGAPQVARKPLVTF